MTLAKNETYALWLGDDAYLVQKAEITAYGMRRVVHGEGVGAPRQLQESGRGSSTPALAGKGAARAAEVAEQARRRS